MENKYEQTFIYKILCKDETITDCYIGHTTNMTGRKIKHKYNCITENGKAYHYKVYEFIRSNNGWDNFKMEIVEHFPCKTKGEAMGREQEIATELGATLGIKAKRTKEEEIIYKAKWFQKNKEKINESKRVIGCKNKVKSKAESDKMYRESHQEQLKEKKSNFYEKNKEKIKEQHKIYRETNEIKNKTKYTCACGKEIQFKSKWSHEKTDFHKNKINVDIITV